MALPKATHDTAITEHAVVIPSHIVAIVARYSGPTDTRGSCIRVHRADDSARTAIRVSWDYSLGMSENFAAAVAEYVDRQAAKGNDSWRGRWALAGGQDTYYAVKVGPLVSDD